MGGKTSGDTNRTTGAWPGAGAQASLFPRIGMTALAFLITFAAALAQAQPAKWPNRPIQILVGFPAGGLHDVTARVLAASMSQTLGATLVVVPTPGAGGAIALQKVAAAAADGYTIMYTPSPALMARPHQMGLPISYRDFTALGTVASAFPTISVKKDHRWKSFTELSAAAKTSPGRVTYGTAGVGGLPHLGMEVVAAALGLQLLHVPFQGTPQAIQAALADQIDVVVGDLPHAAIRPLLILSPARVAALPDVPALKETGVDSALFARFMFIGPKALPPEIVQAISKALRIATTDPAVRKQLQDNQVSESFETPEQTAAWWPDDERRYRDVIDKLGLANKP